MDLLVVHGVSLLISGFFFFLVVHGGFMDLVVGLLVVLMVDLWVFFLIGCGGGVCLV